MALAAAMASLAAVAEAITLVAPRDGEEVPLLSEQQRAFMRMPREARAAFFDDSQPRMEKAVKRYRSTPRPVTLRWSGEGGPYEVEVTKRGAAVPWFRGTSSSNSVEVWNLEIAATYDWTVRAGDECARGWFATEDQAPRLICIPKVPNVRDLGGRVIGGRRVRQGLVYRSSGLNNNATTNAPGTARLTETWREYMRNQLGIKTDIDLRSTRERFGMTCSPLGPDVRFVTMPTNYHGYAAVHTSGADDTRRVLRIFLDRANYPIDIHCIGGADRTGTVATILHGILGLDDDEIWKDYQVTAWQGGINDAKHLKWFTQFVESFGRFEGKTLSERIRKYVLWLGFTEADMQKFRDIMFESEEPDAFRGEEETTWGLMLQLGHNMWGEAPLSAGEAATNRWSSYAAGFNRTDQTLWDEVTGYAAKKGVNLLLIDLGEGMVYPSHPELAVEGSWQPSKMKAELARLRRLGLEPIPKLNFSASHDAWLKDYGRMASTPEYYKVCADIIRDVCEIFGKPRLFHLGWDEEKFAAQKRMPLAVVRQGDLWWHDFLFTVGEVERNGSRAWVWSDRNWKHHEEFMKRMPHAVMQSNWHYFRMQHTVRNDEEIEKRDWPEAWAGPVGFIELEEGRYDQIPCGSNYKLPENFEILVRFCMERVARERIKGFLMAPWVGTFGEENRRKLLEACDLIENARRVWDEKRKADNRE